MRKTLSSLLLMALLPGCGYTPPTPEQPQVVETQRLVLSSQQLAEDLAQSLEGIKAQIKVSDSLVTVQHEGYSPLRYDFTKAPMTGRVRIECENYQGSLPLSSLSGNSNRLAKLTQASIELAIGAAKGGAAYRLNHPQNTSQDELCKGMATGAVFALRPYSSDLSRADSQDLEKVAALIVASAKNQEFEGLVNSGLAQLEVLIDLVARFDIV